MSIFQKQGKIPREVAFIYKDVLRGVFLDNQAEEITRCFIIENNLAVDYANFENHSISSDYIQACTECELVVISRDSWLMLNQKIEHWDVIQSKMVQKCLYQKSRKHPIIAQDATTRYLEFLNNYPGLVNRIPLSYIASYIGVTLPSLSRIRRKIRS